MPAQSGSGHGACSGHAWGGVQPLIIALWACMQSQALVMGLIQVMHSLAEMTGGGFRGQVEQVNGTCR